MKSFRSLNMIRFRLSRRSGPAQSPAAMPRVSCIVSSAIFSAIARRQRAARAGRRRRPPAARPRVADGARRNPPARAAAARRAATGSWPPWIAGRCAVAAHQPPAFDLLRGVVDRDVRVRLEEPDLAHAVAADAAGRHVGDAAGREPQPRVGDVELAASAPARRPLRSTSTSDRTSARMMSRSWIIRSKTTSMSRLRSGNAPSRCTSMNRGEVDAAAAPRRPPGCSARCARPPASRRTRAAAAISSSASASDRAIGFSTSTRDAALEKRQRDVAVQLGRHRDRHRVDLAEQLADSRSARARRSPRRSPRRASGLRVDHRRRARTPSSVRQDPRVVPAQVADADDRDAQRVSASALPASPAARPRRRSRCRPRSADVEHVLAVEHQRPARVDRQRRRAGAPHRLDRRDADDRHVEPHVLLRLRHLDDRARRGRPDARPGAITSSVPSIASTATTALCLTAIVWPMSSAGDRVGHRGSRTRSPRAPRSVGARSVSTPVARQQRRQERRRIEQLDALVAHARRRPRRSARRCSAPSAASAPTAASGRARCRRRS